MKRKNNQRYGVSLLLFLLGIFVSTGIFAQNSISISGIVKDQSGEDIIGASILVKGTAVGTITDLDGRFELDVPSDATIIVSSVGLISQEIAVKGNTTFNIVLKDNDEVLKEVVVIGYGSVKKDDLTGSVSAIKVDEMNKGLSTSPQELMTGKIPGVSVMSTGGQPGAGSTIRIRGGSSLNASNNPLFVIDGVIMSSEVVDGLSNPLSTVNPSDIETFTVLKDASATAIYGSRASNGVIIITTKKGKSGKIKFTYNGNVSVNSVRKQYDVLNGEEYRNLVLVLTDVTPEMKKALDLYPGESTNWQDQVLRTALSTDHNFSVLGSFGKNVPYRASFGYTEENGIVKTSNFGRLTGSISVSPNLLNDHLKLNINTKGTHIRNRFADVGALGSAFSFDPTKPVMNDSKFGGYYTWTSGDSKDGPKASSTATNPLAMLEMTEDKSTVQSFVGNVQTDYKLHFFPDVRVNLNLAMDYSKSNGDKYVEPNSPSRWSENEDETGENYLYKNIYKNSLLEFYSQYAKDLESIKSRFDVMAGYSYQKFSREGNKESYYLSRNSGRFGERTKHSSEYERFGPSNNVLISFYGRLNYTLLDRYLMTMTVRRDGSSRFAKDHRWGTFPSLALGWKMKDEAFFKNINELSSLKLRLGFGMTGQQDLGSAYFFPSATSYSWGKGGAMYPMYDNAGNVTWVNVIKPTAATPDLKWEETTTWNAGIDYGFFNNRINGSIDYYFRRTKNLLNNSVNVAAGTNFAELVPKNVGTLENKGLEISVNALAISTKDFSWDLGYNVSFSKSKITELTFDDAISTSPGYRFEPTGGNGGKTIKIHSVGYAPSSFYVYEQIYDEKGLPIEGAYVDRNEDGKIDDGDLYRHKKPDADVLMGFSSKFTYKQWDLGFNGRVSLGNYVYNAIEADNAAISASGMFTNNSLSNRTNEAVRVGFKERQRLSDYYVQNASFLKVDNITLGFSPVLSKTIQTRFFATVQNPIVITKYKGLDPEVAGIDINKIFTHGMDKEIYPRPFTIVLGVNLNF